MNLILVTALIAVCGADKLDRTYLPPASATTAGGNPGSLQTPFKTFNQGLGGLPKGGYSNDFEGVVVDAAAPGTRASGADETGLGGPRITYGSTDSKVGEAAFTSDAAFPRVGINSGLITQGAVSANNLPQNFASRPERVQASRDRVSNIVKYENDVSPDSFNYAFETDNGIVAEENGIEVNGVKAKGGYSYTGDDGQVYSVTYTADEEGYRPKGDHLPTPPPIPADILESLEKNAQDEAAGIVDDGSYDAQKYNNGEDYTKTDNGQYNGQATQLGNRPQSDAVASGSFISQNNQGFVRPNSPQFGSTPSRDSSKNVLSTGNNFGVPSSIRPSQNSQTFGFGVASNNEYLPPSNGFNQNRRPASNGLHGVQNGFPISSSTSNNNYGFNKKQNAEIPVFIPLGQQKLQDDRPKRPQSSSPIFGKPTVIDSTLSIKDPFAKRPSNNRFPQNQQSNLKPQAVGGSFEVVSGNVFSSKNEYLPPRRQNNTPNPNNGNKRFQGITSGTQPNQQFTQSQLFNPHSSSASAFASVSRPSTGFSSSQQHNSQPIPQYSGNNLFNQANHNSNSGPINQDQSPLGSGITNIPSFNRSPTSQSQYRPSTFASQSPTLTPQIELTTPLESNYNQNKDTAPNPTIDGPDSSSSPSFGSQPSNNFLGQYNFNTNKGQQALPTQASPAVISTLNDQSIATGSQNSPKPGRPAGNFGFQSQSNISPINEQPSFSSQRPGSQSQSNISPTNEQPSFSTQRPGFQSQSNILPINEQPSFSTQRPGFSQYTQQQGSDDSYYYNTPSKPFNTPTPRPQASLFPSTQFDQTIKVTQAPFGSKSPSEISFTSQSNTPAEPTRYPKPTLGPISPTRPTQQDEQTGNTFQSQFNKVTQASTSSFPSPTPITSAAFQGNQFGQSGTKPVQSQIFSQQVSSSQPQQQYGGEIYQYKKPPQTLPSSQNGTSSGQFGQTSQFGSSLSAPQIGQSQGDGTYKPSSQFTQQPFGQRPQSSQVSQENQGFNVNNPTQTQQRPGQFSSQSSNPQSSRPIQGASKFPPAYNKPGSSCCKQLGSFPEPGQAGEQDRTPQYDNQFRPNQDFSQQGPEQESKPAQSVSTFAGVGETFGGPRKPPSFDKDGYHY